MEQTQTANKFLWKIPFGPSGRTAQEKFSAGLDEVDARLGNEVWVGDPGHAELATLSQALDLYDTGGARAGTKVTLRWIGNQTMPSGADQTVPANVTLQPVPGQGYLTIPAGRTLTVNGHIQAGLSQIFVDNSADLTKGVKFGKGAVAYVRPEWWGAVGDGGSGAAQKAANTAAINQAVCSLVNCAGAVEYSGSYRVSVASAPLALRKWVSHVAAGAVRPRVATNSPVVIEVVSNDGTLFDCSGAADVSNFSVIGMAYRNTSPVGATPHHAFHFNAATKNENVSFVGCSFNGFTNHLHAAAMYGTTPMHIFEVTGCSGFQTNHMIAGYIYDSVIHHNPNMCGGSVHAVAWTATATKALGAQVRPTNTKLNGFFFEATSIGSAPNKTGSTEPTWPTAENGTVVDGDITWTARTGPASMYFYGGKNVIGGNIFNAGGIVTSAAAADTEVIGNLFDMILGYGFKHNGAASRLDLMGNDFTNCYLDGININNGRAIITGNTFNLIGIAGNTVGGYGINLNGYQTDCLVKNNEIGTCVLGKINSTFSGVFNNLRFNGGVVEDNIGVDVGNLAGAPALSGTSPNVSISSIYKSAANGNVVFLQNNCPGKRLRLALVDTGTTLNKWGVDSNAKVYTWDQSAGAGGWSANLYNTGGWSLWPAVPAVDDAIYFGNAAGRFAGVRLYPDSTPGGSPTYSWYYWNGSAWAALTVSQADIFTVTGSYQEAEFTPPDDWTPSNLLTDSGPSVVAYFVKVVITASPPPDPGAIHATNKAEHSYIRLNSDTVTLAGAGGLALVDLLNIGGVFFQVN